MYNKGIAAMRDSISNTAEYGDLTRGPRIITEETKATMKTILNEIQTGKFAKEWILENQVNKPVLNALRAVEKQHFIEKVGGELRKLMSWLKQ